MLVSKLFLYCVVAKASLCFQFTNTFRISYESVQLLVLKFLCFHIQNHSRYVNKWRGLLLILVLIIICTSNANIGQQKRSRASYILNGYFYKQWTKIVNIWSGQVLVNFDWQKISQFVFQLLRTEARLIKWWYLLLMLLKLIY